MALQGSHVNSHEGMQPGTTCRCRYPTRHQADGMERTKGRGQLASLQGATEMKTWAVEIKIRSYSVVIGTETRPARWACSREGLMTGMFGSL